MHRLSESVASPVPSQIIHYRKYRYHRITSTVYQLQHEHNPFRYLDGNRMLLDANGIKENLQRASL